MLNNCSIIQQLLHKEITFVKRNREITRVNDTRKLQLPLISLFQIAYGFIIWTECTSTDEEHCILLNSREGSHEVCMLGMTTQIQNFAFCPTIILSFSFEQNSTRFSLSLGFKAWITVYGIWSAFTSRNYRVWSVFYTHHPANPHNSMLKHSKEFSHFPKNFFWEI